MRGSVERASQRRPPSSEVASLWARRKRVQAQRPRRQPRGGTADASPPADKTTAGRMSPATHSLGRRGLGIWGGPDSHRMTVPLRNRSSPAGGGAPEQLPPAGQRDAIHLSGSARAPQAGFRYSAVLPDEEPEKRNLWWSALRLSSGRAERKASTHSLVVDRGRWALCSCGVHARGRRNVSFVAGGHGLGSLRRGTRACRTEQEHQSKSETHQVVSTGRCISARSLWAGLNSNAQPSRLRSREKPPSRFAASMASPETRVQVQSCASGAQSMPTMPCASAHPRAVAAPMLTASRRGSARGRIHRRSR